MHLKPLEVIYRPALCFQHALCLIAKQKKRKAEYHSVSRKFPNGDFIHLWYGLHHRKVDCSGQFFLFTNELRLICEKEGSSLILGPSMDLILSEDCRLKSLQNDWK